MLTDEGRRVARRGLRHDGRYAHAMHRLSQTGLFIFASGMLAALVELALWLGHQYWPFVTLMELIGTCTACDSGLTAPFASWVWRQPLSLLVACAGLPLMFLGMALRRDD
jgi:hypothetical protein